MIQYEVETYTLTDFSRRFAYRINDLKRSIEQMNNKEMIVGLTSWEMRKRLDLKELLEYNEHLYLITSPKTRYAQ